MRRQLQVPEKPNGKARGLRVDPNAYPRKRTGRPARNNDPYQTSMPRMVEMLRKLGATDDEVADAIGITRVTLHHWVHGENAKPEFADAYMRGGIIADGEVVESMYQRALGYSHPETKVFMHEGNIIEHEVTRHYPPDSVAGFKWLFNRRRQYWRDRVSQEITGADGQPLQPPQLVLQALGPPAASDTTDDVDDN